MNTPASSTKAIRTRGSVAVILSGCSLFLIAFFFQVHVAAAFTKDGCGSGECRDCHAISKEEAAKLLTLTPEEIADIKTAEVPGLWEVDVKQQGKVLPLFIDFSKQYLISGSVIKIADKQDVTRKRYIDLNRADVSSIPLADALVLGDPSAKTKVIIFDDPQCPYCAKLHGEMKQLVTQRPDIAFYIKMFPLKSHPESYIRAKTIVCSKSLAILEDSLSGGEVAEPSCETDQIEKNIKLAEQLGIHSTPTLVFPDGRVIPGYKTVEEIVRLLGPGSQK